MSRTATGVLIHSGVREDGKVLPGTERRPRSRESVKRVRVGRALWRARKRERDRKRVAEGFKPSNW